MALGATLTVQGPGGSSTKTMEQFLPGVSIVDGRVKENSLRYNEIVTQINIPLQHPEASQRLLQDAATGRPSTSRSRAAQCPRPSTGPAFRTRGSFSVASPEKPLRAKDAESFLSGQQLNEANIATAATKALAGATPLTEGTGNTFRVYIAQGVVKKALRSLPNSS